MPPECNHYTAIDDSTRKASHVGRTDGCDSNLEEKWYRFLTAGSKLMASTCVREGKCGTDAPGWLAEKHPTFAEGIVLRKVCFSWYGGCCNWQIKIKVRNCAGFYTYELKKTSGVQPHSSSGCPLRYCSSGKTSKLHNLAKSNEILVTFISALQFYRSGRFAGSEYRQFLKEEKDPNKLYIIRQGIYRRVRITLNIRKNILISRSSDRFS